MSKVRSAHNRSANGTYRDFGEGSSGFRLPQELGNVLLEVLVDLLVVEDQAERVRDALVAVDPHNGLVGFVEVDVHVRTHLLREGDDARLQDVQVVCMPANPCEQE